MDPGIWTHFGLKSRKYGFYCWQIYIAVNRFHIGEKIVDYLLDDPFASHIEWVQF